MTPPDPYICLKCYHELAAAPCKLCGSDRVILLADFGALHDHGELRQAEIKRYRIEAAAGEWIVIDRVHHGTVYCPEQISFGVLKDGGLVQVAGPPPRSSEWSLARVEARRRVACCTL